jgi:RNA polymerase sigma-70 factor (ECF subfamily)
VTRNQTNSQQDPDVELMLAFQAGNEEAFVKLYEKYRDRMIHFTRRFLSDVAQSEEAAQDVFLKLYKTRDRYTPSARFSTYLYRIATNHCLNIQGRLDTKLVDRHQSVEERYTDVPCSPGETPEESAQRTELRGALEKALQGLPKNQRAALVLCHYEGMSYREASSILALTESAVKSLLHRAREKLMAELRPLRHGEVLNHEM